MELIAGRVYYFKFPEFTGFAFVDRRVFSDCNICALRAVCARLVVQNIKHKYIGSCTELGRSDNHNIVIRKPIYNFYFKGSPELKVFFQHIGIDTKRFRFVPSRVYYLEGRTLRSKPLLIFNVYNYIPIVIEDIEGAREFKIEEPEEIDTISHGKE